MNESMKANIVERAQNSLTRIGSARKEHCAGDPSALYVKIQKPEDFNPSHEQSSTINLLEGIIFNQKQLQATESAKKPRIPKYLHRVNEQYHRRIVSNK